MSSFKSNSKNKSDDIFLMVNKTLKEDRSTNELILTSIASVFKAKDLKNTALRHWDTCFLMTLNVGTVVYFELIPQTLSG